MGKIVDPKPEPRDVCLKEPEVRTQWIEAGKILAVDSTAAVNCPVCRMANLVVVDSPIAGLNRFERTMFCPNCHSKNILLLNRKN